MTKQIFVNMPVKNLEATMAFYTKLGFQFNMQFTDEKAACMIIEDNIYVMLLLEEFFTTFTKKDIADAGKTTEMILALSADSIADVDEMVEKAVAAGGKSYLPAQDHGWMYARSFEDIDGHMWETLYMDPNGPDSIH